MIRRLTATMIGLGMLSASLSNPGDVGVLAPGATVQQAADGFPVHRGAHV